MWICLFMKHVLFKVEKYSSFPKDKVLTTAWSFLLLLDTKEYDKNALSNLQIFAYAVGCGAFGSLFFFLNHLKLVNLIPALIEGFLDILDHLKCLQVFASQLSCSKTFLYLSFWCCVILLWGPLKNDNFSKCSTWDTSQESFYFAEKLWPVLKIFKFLYF